MRKIAALCIFSFVFLTVSAFGQQNKVVVIPLNSSKSTQSNWINLNIFSSFIAGSATFTTGFGQHSGISLPDTGTPQFAMNFTIPPNYKEGTDMTVSILWHTSSTNCNFVFRENSMSVTRIGSTPLLGPSASSGLNIVGGTTISADPSISNFTQQTQVIISSPDSSTNLQPQDAVVFGLYRWAENAGDTCTGDMRITGSIVSYETK